jgi:hypothetical protein
MWLAGGPVMVRQPNRLEQPEEEVDNFRALPGEIVFAEVPASGLNTSTDERRLIFKLFHRGTPRRQKYICKPDNGIGNYARYI